MLTYLHYGKCESNCEVRHPVHECCHCHSRWSSSLGEQFGRDHERNGSWPNTEEQSVEQDTDDTDIFHPVVEELIGGHLQMLI